MGENAPFGANHKQMAEKIGWGQNKIWQRGDIQNFWFSSADVKPSHFKKNELNLISGQLVDLCWFCAHAVWFDADSSPGMKFALD